MIEKGNSISAYVVDDEPLAVKRLSTMLRKAGRVKLVGSSTSPKKALSEIEEAIPDVLFLDIKMPEMTGFELLDSLSIQPPVIFTTAFDEHSLDAFEYFSVDYLVKPIDEERLNTALDKLSRMNGLATPVISGLNKERSGYDGYPISRIYSRTGSKLRVLRLEEITHFFSEDKVSFAATIDGSNHPVEESLSSLEKVLNPSQFFRIHRSSIVNLDLVSEVQGRFSGGIKVLLKDAHGTRLAVARSRVKQLKERLV